MMRPPGTRLGSTSSGPPQFTRTGWHASVAAHRRLADRRFALPGLAHNVNHIGLDSWQTADK